MSFSQNIFKYACGIPTFCILALGYFHVHKRIIIIPLNGN